MTSMDEFEFADKEGSHMPKLVPKQQK